MRCVSILLVLFFYGAQLNAAPCPSSDINNIWGQDAVQAALDDMWLNSLEGTGNEREMGAFVNVCVNSPGNFTIQVDTIPGAVAHVDMPAVPNSMVCHTVAWMHTHPGPEIGSPGEDGYANNEASTADRNYSRRYNLPGIIRFGTGNDPNNPDRVQDFVHNGDRGSRGYADFCSRHAARVAPDLSENPCFYARGDAFRLCRRGRAYGEPHLKTFDGLSYDLQTVGEFIAAKSTVDNFEVQMRMKAYKNSKLVSANSAVAMNVAGQKVGFYDPSQLRIVINGKTHKHINPITRLKGGGKIIKLSRNKYLVVWPDKTTVKLVVVSKSLIDVQIALNKKRHGKVVGLLGNADGKKLNDLSRRDGKLIDIGRSRTSKNKALYGQLAPSWRIKQSESLFTYKTGENTKTLTDLNFPRSYTDISKLDQAKVAVAKKLCRSSGLKIETQINNCAYDIVVTGDKRLAMSTVNNYLNKPVRPFLKYTNSDNRILEFKNKIASGFIPNLINGRKQFTIEMWFYYLDAKTWRWLYGSGPGWNQVGMAIMPKYHHVRYHFTTSNGKIYKGNGKYKARAKSWNHIALTYDGKMLRAYLNSGLDYSYPISGTVVSTQQQSIGAGFWKNGEIFKGYIDEVRIWGKAKNIIELFKTSRIELSGTEPDLLAYWDFNGAIKSKAINDVTANKHVMRLGSNTTIKSRAKFLVSRSNWLTFKSEMVKFREALRKRSDFRNKLYREKYIVSSDKLKEIVTIVENIIRKSKDIRMKGLLGRKPRVNCGGNTLNRFNFIKDSSAYCHVYFKRVKARFSKKMGSPETHFVIHKKSKKLYKQFYLR